MKTTSWAEAFRKLAEAQGVASDYLTISEAATFLRLNPTSLKNKMRQGIFKRGVHYWKREGAIGVRFKRQALIDWLEGGKTEKDG